VPAAGCLRDLVQRDEAGAEPVTAARVLPALLDRLRHNYDLLLRRGAGELLEEYRRRSVILGRQVRVLRDDAAAAGIGGGNSGRGDVAAEDVLAAGRVTGIGDGLELYLDGTASPVMRGRLLLEG
jgi:biotin-(acetyl-CoA carboxylase) ligase